MYVHIYIHIWVRQPSACGRTAGACPSRGQPAASPALTL